MNLPKQANLVLDHRYFNGSFKDYSGNSNDGTPTTCHFEKHPDKHIKFEGTDLITVADSSELQLTAMTLIAYGNFEDYIAADRVISKKDGVGSNWEWYMSDTTMRINDGVNDKSATFTWKGAKSLAITVAAGSSIPKAYKDGVFATDFNGAIILSADDAPVKIGNRYSGGQPNPNPIKGVLIYNTALTDEEMAQAHEWIMQQTSPSFMKKNFSYPSRITGKEDGLVFGADMENVHGKIIDKTGNNNNGTITDCTQTNGLQGIKALDFNGTSSIVTISDNAILDLDSDMSISILVKQGVIGSYNEVFTKRDGTDEGFKLDIDDGEVRFVYENTDGDVITLQSSEVLENNVWYHLMVTVDKDGDSTLYIDNVSKATDTTPSGLIGNADDLKIGGLVNFFTGQIAEPQLFDYVLSADDRKALYNQYAKLSTFIDDLKDANESIAVEGGAIGAPLSNTEWKFGDTTARYKVSRDENLEVGAKVIECTTGGTLYQESLQAYGTWEFDFYKIGSTNIYVLFMADTIGGNEATGQDAYMFYGNTTEIIRLRENNDGVGSNLFATTTAYFSPSNWYSMRVTRRYDGTFTFYIKGGAFTTWTLVVAGSNPVLDDTITTSKYVVLDMEAGDKIANFKFYNGVITP